MGENGSKTFLSLGVIFDWSNPKKTCKKRILNNEAVEETLSFWLDYTTIKSHARKTTNRQNQSEQNDLEELTNIIE